MIFRAISKHLLTSRSDTWQKKKKKSFLGVVGNRRVGIFIIRARISSRKERKIIYWHHILKFFPLDLTATCVNVSLSHSLCVCMSLWKFKAKFISDKQLPIRRLNYNVRLHTRLISLHAWS